MGAENPRHPYAAGKIHGSGPGPVPARNPDTCARAEVPLAGDQHPVQALAAGASSGRGAYPGGGVDCVEIGQVVLLDVGRQILEWH